LLRVTCFPCRERDVQKIGYARIRSCAARAASPLSSAFFDLERGVRGRDATVREARALERRATSLASRERVPAPLEARELAAGEHEWFCGVAPAAARWRWRAYALAHGMRVELLADLAAQPHRRPPAARLWQWSERSARGDRVTARHNVPAELGAKRAERALVDALGLCEALGLDAGALVRREVLAHTVALG
jgi:hypothetical protein